MLTTDKLTYFTRAPELLTQPAQLQSCPACRTLDETRRRGGRGVERLDGGGGVRGERMLNYSQSDLSLFDFRRLTPLAANCRVSPSWAAGRGGAARISGGRRGGASCLSDRQRAARPPTGPSGRGGARQAGWGERQQSSRRQRDRMAACKTESTRSALPQRRSRSLVPTHQEMRHKIVACRLACYTHISLDTRSREALA